MSRMNEELRRDSRKDPAELEREIDATRAELRATLEELENKLSPRDILDQVVSRMRRDGSDLAGNLGNSIKENPMPALLTSIGIAWMMASGRSDNGRARATSSRQARAGRRQMRGASGQMRESADRMRDSASGHMRESTDRMRDSASRIRDRWRGAKESVRQRGESAREGLASKREAVRGRARGMSSAARQRAERARSGFDYLWHEQPLVLGAIGLAAGAIAGAALPPTEQEDEALGQMRDRALQRAKAAGLERARHARERVERAAAGAMDREDDIRSRRSASSSQERSPEQHREQPTMTPETPESSPGAPLRY